MLTKENSVTGMVKGLLTETVWIRLIKLIILFGILPFAILSFYNQPVYDDFGNAHRTIKYGAWGVQHFLYQGWTGRYFSSLLLTVGNPLSYHWIDGVRYTPLVFMLGIFGVLYCYINFLLSGTRAQNLSFWLALVGLLVYLYAMPQVFQGFFWYTGASVYQIGNALVILTLLASSKVFSVTNSNVSKRLWAVLAILMGGAAAATNEVALLQLLGVIFLCFMVAIFQKNTAWKWWVMLGTAICIAALFAIIAPGNFVRLAALSAPHSKSVVYALPRTLFSGIELITRPAILISFMLIMVGWLPLGLQVASKENVQVFRVHPVIGLLFLFAVTSMCYFPFWWIWAAFTPVRTENAIVFFLLVGWLAWVQSTLIWLRYHNVVVPSPQPWLVKYSVPLFGLMLLVRSISMPAWLELGANARRYNAHLSSRFAYIQLHKNDADTRLVVEPLVLAKAYNILTDGSGLSADTTAGPNISVAEYFDIKSIRSTSDDGVEKQEKPQ